MKEFVKKDPVLFVLLVITALFTLLNPSGVKNYWSYVDWRTIVSLSGLILVTTGIKESRILNLISRKVVRRGKTERKLSFLLISLSSVLSTILTNDVTLLVLVPMTAAMSEVTDVCVGKLIVFETLSVNVGSALTPVGNPQNLFLWHEWGISFFQFCLEMLPVVVLCILVLLLFSVFSFKKKELALKADKKIEVDKNLAFASTILTLMYIFSLELKLEYLAFPLILAFFAFVNRRVIRNTDWLLIAIFVLMFVDIGCVTKYVRPLILHLKLNSSTVFLISALLSQLVSNVPASILMAKFSSNWKAICYGVNVGGNGFLVASLANLISLRYSKNLAEFHKYSLPYFVLTLVLTYLLFFKPT